MSKNNILEVKNLRKRFISKRSVTNAIDNVSFDVPKGKIVGLIGESGSGKTTIGRNIIRLHIPNSGSVKMEGHEFASKKVAAETRKFLRKNVQMIFQDPYASLNGQKNIMSIVSEPLLVNGTHKLMLSEILDKRNDVIEFFGFALKKEYLNDWSNYENNKYNQMKNAFEEIKKLMNEFNHIKGKSALENIQELINIYFDQLDLAKIEILISVRELVEVSLKKWDEYKLKLLNDKFFDKSEEKLKEAREVVAEINRKINSSEKLEKIEKELKDINDKVSHQQELIDVTHSLSKQVVSELAREYRAKYDEYKTKADNRPTYAEFNHLNFLARQNDFMISVLKKIKKIENLSVPGIGEILANFDNEIYVATEAKVRDLISKISDRKLHFEKENFFDGNLMQVKANKLINEIKNISDKWFKENKIMLEKLLLTKKGIEEQIILEKNAIKSRNNDKLIAELEKAKIAEEQARELNDKERIKFVKDNESTILIKLDKLKNGVLKDIELQKSIEKESIKILSEKIKNIEKSFKESNNNKSLRKFAEQKRKIRYMLDDREAKIKQFNIEIDKNEKELLIVRKLFNITSSSKSVTITDKAVVMNPVDKLKLRSLLVRRKVFKTLVEVGMNESHASRYPHEFSGGMRQRVGIARAIINDPKLIIADEPIAALDLSIQAQVMNLLMKLKRERELSMILIAHDLSMVRYNSDYIQIMHLGKIVEHGDTESVFTNPVHPYTKNLIASMPEISEISKGFKGNIFKPEYLKNYSHINVPTYHKLSEGHYVLADEAQIIEWTKKKVTPKASSVAKIESKKEITKKAVKAKPVAKKSTPVKKATTKPVSKVRKNVKKAKS